MFRKSIFGQLFGFTILVFIISFFVIGTLLYGFVGEYASNKYESELAEVSDKLSNLSALVLSSDNEYFRQIMQSNIDTISASSSTYIFILNKSGKVIMNTGGISLPTELGEDYYKDALEGRSVKFIGKLGGVFNTTVLTIARPVMSDSEVIGAVFMNSPIPEINRLRTEVLKLFLLSVCFVIVIAMIFIYMMSRKITKPLNAINKAAKSISSGNFKRRVDLTGVENEIGELGESFNQMADSLEQLETMRSSFISNVSHELRTPMTTITGFVEGIIDGTIPPQKQEQYLTIVLDESRRLSRLITDLLDLGKLDNSNMKLEKREFDINEMLRLSIIKTEKRITDKNIKLTVSFESEMQLVFADKDSILRVVTNLFDNAIKFTPENGFIDIITGISNKKAFVTILNSGLGVSEAELTHIFDRFYKTDKSRSLDKTGVGLGLFIVKSIITAHGENVWAQSKLNEYTSFTFTLEPRLN